MSEDLRFSPKFIVDRMPTVQRFKKTVVRIMPISTQTTEIKKVKESKKNEFYLLMPKSLFPIIKQIESDPPKIPGFKISYIKEIIHLIASRIEDDGFSYLKKDYLKKIVRQADLYIDLLKSQGIIEQTKFFQLNYRSYGYKFTTAHQDSYLKVPLKDMDLYWKIRHLYTELNEKNNQYPTQCRFIESLTIDPDAEDFARAFYKGENLKYALSAITKIQNKELFHIVDDTGGRFHSNATNLNKELRAYIQVNGKHLVANADIKNSLPFFGIMILTNPKKAAMFAKSRELRMILKNLQIPDTEDAKLYKKIAVNGELYEALWDEFHKRGIYFQDKKVIRYKIPDRQNLNCYAYDTVRSNIKTMVYRILFDQNRKKPSRAKQVFIDFFPIVDKIFSQVRGNLRGSRFVNFKRFAILLQNLESYVILKVILKKVYKENHVSLTVHDSTLLTDSPKRIAEIMKEEIKNLTGSEPQIKVEKIAKIDLFLTKQTVNREKGEGGERGRGEGYYCDNRRLIN